MEMITPTLSVPEIKMQAGRGEAARLCACRTRIASNTLLGPDIDLMITSDSPTASGMCCFVNDIDKPYPFQPPTCGIARIVREDELPGSESAKATLPHHGRITLDISRFLKQAAVSVGVFSVGLGGSLPMAEAAGLPHGVLSRWLRSIDDEDLSRPIIEFDPMNQIAVLSAPSDTDRTSVGRFGEGNGMAVQHGSLPGYIRVPPESVRVSSYLDEERFESDSTVFEARLAVEKFYEPDNAYSEKT
jgi:hypothetical protein